ncbi:MAG TPA: DUF4058 family protein, partial [Urbifossiella sp.]|nr:DUF4058 family protein [Urbifossiella sp.]
RHVLNSGVLPPGYYALNDQVVYPLGPDVLALRPPEPVGPPAPAGGTALAVSPPAVATTARAAKQLRRRAYRRLSVRHVSGHRVVAVVELISPGNKSGPRDFTAFVDKAVWLLDERVNLVLIDPFPPTRRDPAGVHAAVWKALTRKAYTPPPDKPLTAAAYVGGDDVTAFVEPFAVGTAVPTMPLFLNPDEYVNVPLEAAYQAAWAEVPGVWRAVLEAP